MKNLYLLNLIYALSMLFISLNCSAQCTLGASYDQLKELYHKKAKFVNWKDQVADNGTKYVSYDDKEEEVSIYSHFEADEVVQYKLIGPVKPWANTWGEYFDKNFAIQGGNKWVDYGTQQVWRLKVDKGFAIIWAEHKE